MMMLEIITDYLPFQILTLKVMIDEPVVPREATDGAAGIRPMKFEQQESDP